ncbi:hypothetical protein K7432_015525 [Basidiobolus ranarum]|uniref:Arrestin C-terminal-like domain-containing protein n=1 Tax=Basidiobolus ranarum TaxID=34480 RepID=A0ABR2VNZ6_9FUNG
MEGCSFKYDFEMTLHEELPESCMLEYGSVQYKFKAIAETSILYSNLKDEKEIFLRQNVNSWLDTVYPTEIDRNWRNILNINMKIPSNQYKLGSVLPLTFRTQLSDETARVVLVSCMLKEHMIFRSPKIHGSSRPVIRDQANNIDMAFTWCKNIGYNEEKVMEINIPFKRCSFDCSNEYVNISHKLHVRVDIQKQGVVESIGISFPILIVPQISSELRFDELGIEQLPGYQVIPPPPSYDYVYSLENLSAISLDSNENYTPFPPRYSTIGHNISVY